MDDWSRHGEFAHTCTNTLIRSVIQLNLPFALATLSSHYTLIHIGTASSTLLQSSRLLLHIRRMYVKYALTGYTQLNEAGRISTAQRNETQLICDILGLESLIDEMTSKLLLRTNSSSKDATPSAVLGPFYRADAPLLANGSSIISPLLARDSPWFRAAQPLLARISGRVLSASTRRPIPDAMVDIWMAAFNGLYEQQDRAHQPDLNLRGRFRTDEKGCYEIYALRPTAYPIPLDGPAGRLLRLLDRSPYRPAHIHFIISAEGHQTLTTQFFDCEDRYTGNDVVFAVKKELLVRFEEKVGDERARWELKYDFSLCGE